LQQPVLFATFHALDFWRDGSGIDPKVRSAKRSAPFAPPPGCAADADGPESKR
jgi:hypothetical protein